MANLLCTNMKIEIGKITKAQGIKGEVKLLCYVDDAHMLKSVKTVFIGQNSHKVLKCRPDGNFCYLLLEGISDRNTAESLREWVVYAEKDSLTLDKGRYFIEDLLGCTVVLTNGACVGKVVDILQYGAADVYMCEGEKNVSFPFLKDLVVSVDIQRQIITLDENRFEEVCVYED